MNQLHFNKAVCETVHIVSAGETLYGIAQRYDTDLQRLIELNGITEPWKLAIGQEICIPKKLPGNANTRGSYVAADAGSYNDSGATGNASAPYGNAAYDTDAALTPTYAGTTHTVQSGETLYGISRKYGISLSLLLESNPAMDPYRLQIGTVLQIPAAASECSTSQPQQSQLRPTAPQQQYQQYQPPQPQANAFPAASAVNPEQSPQPYIPKPAPAPQAIQATPGTDTAVPETTDNENNPPETVPAVSENGVFFHTVRPEDTLTSLLTGYGICLHALLHENPGVDFSGALSDNAGAQICIPTTDRFRRCQENQPYIIQSGDTLYTLSANSGISTDELLRMNPCCNAMDFSLMGTRIRK